jgi:ParB/RepB/Spo0J family partition protein
MATTTPNVQDLAVGLIDPAPDNPRTAFGGDLGDLTELTASIGAQGVLQRLVVCPFGEGRYQLVFGHRRLAAAKLAGLDEVPVEIRDYDEAARLAAMCGENEGREDLTPLQEAWAYQQALERKGPDGKKKLFTQRTLAERLGVSQSHISKYTGIFKLPKQVVAMLTGGELSVTEAIHLIPLARDAARVEAALGDWRQHHDMELAVRTQQADVEREAKVAKTIADLKKRRVRIAPDDWRDRGGQKLGDGYYDLHQTPEEHAGGSCHAAIVTHHGDVAWVCLKPDRHRPADAEPEPAAPAPAAAGLRDAAAGEPAQAAPGEDGDAHRPAAAAGDPDGSEEDGAAALEVKPPPDPEVLAAKQRMDEARRVAEEERAQREREAAELEANLTAAYEARTEALRTLLGGRLSRPEVTRLLASFLVRLTFRDFHYDDQFLRHALSLDQPVGAGEESPVLAFAAKAEDALLRAAVAVVAENAEDALVAGEEVDFDDPLFRLYLAFLMTVAAYQPTEFEQTLLEAAAGQEEGVDAAGEDATGAEEPDFTNPIVALYYEFLGTVAAYQPSEFEAAALGQDTSHADAEAAAAEAAAEEAVGS